MEIPEEANYKTDYRNDILIAREISQLLFLERMKPIMESVAQKLVESGVDFSKVKQTNGE